MSVYFGFHGSHMTAYLLDLGQKKIKFVQKDIFDFLEDTKINDGSIVISPPSSEDFQDPITKAKFSPEEYKKKFTSLVTKAC